jgi:hypothetical protein
MADSILSTVIVTLLVGGSSPWWYAAIKGKTGSKKSEDDSPVQTQSVVKVAEIPLLATREFFIGRWRVEQAIGSLSGANNVDYFNDGNFDGEEMRVYENQGQRVRLTGTWEMMPLSDRMFRLELHQTDAPSASLKFKIIDRNHIQNVDQNYMAERVE